MSDLQSGKYWIQLAVDPKPRIGVDITGAPVEPVVTYGTENVWTVTKLEDGNYSLVLERYGRTLFIQDDDGKLVGSTDPPPAIWTIRGPDHGPYTIEVPSPYWPNKGWTVNDPESKKPVTISLIEIPLPNQKWNFVRWPGPE